MQGSLNRRITVYFLIIMALTVVVSVAWNYFSTRQSILTMEQELANGCMQTLSTLLDHYRDALQEDADSQQRSFVTNAARNFCLGFDQEALHIYSRDPMTGERRMLLSVHALEEADASAGESPDGLFPQPAMLDEAEAALLSQDERLQRVEWGTHTNFTVMWIAQYAGPGTPNPVFVAMEYSQDIEEDRILSDFLSDILTPVVALGIAFLVLNLMIRRRVVRPIRLISERMMRFAQNSSVRPEPLNLSYKDERPRTCWGRSSRTLTPTRRASSPLTTRRCWYCA